MLGRPATDDEAERFSALTSPELYHLLTVTRWTQPRYAEWLERTVTSLLQRARKAVRYTRSVRSAATRTGSDFHAARPSPDENS